MSWENTKCPCGGRKESETMLCRDCEEYLEDRPEMAIFRGDGDPDLRRHAAITLLALARGREHAQYRERMSNGGLRPGEPCNHPGCLSHVSHPCEGCGRIAGR